MPSAQPEEQDQSMVDVEADPNAQVPEEDADEEQELEIAENRVTILSGATETAASFQFKDEGHTLGNALRYVIMKNPAVEFCGYTIPHPSEAKMNLRIQTYGKLRPVPVRMPTLANGYDTENTTAVEALEKGLDDLMDLCDVVTDKFTVARDNFNAAKADQMAA